MESACGFVFKKLQLSVMESGGAVVPSFTPKSPSPSLNDNTNFNVCPLPITVSEIDFNSIEGSMGYCGSSFTQEEKNEKKEKRKKAKANLFAVANVRR